MQVDKKSFNVRRIIVAEIALAVGVMQGCNRTADAANFRDYPGVEENKIFVSEDNQMEEESAEIQTEETDSTEFDVEVVFEEVDISADSDTAAQAYDGPTVTLIMVGDILLHTPVAESGVQEDGSYNFDALFANVREEIAAADLALVNQEVIIGGEELDVSGYPSFNLSGSNSPQLCCVV